MRKYLLSTLLYLVAATALSQKILPEFGDVQVSDLSLKQCLFEPEATAMKMFDVQDIEFNFWGYGARIETKRRVRIKIFNEAGYKYASIKTPYAKNGSSKIKSLKGIVYSLDPTGKIITQRLESDDFFKEKSSENMQKINFTFPNVRSGSIVEYSYTKVEPNVLQLDTWVVQDEIPTAYAVTNLEIQMDAGVIQRTLGGDSVSSKREDLRNNWQRTIYYKENIPSFNHEPYMSSWKDNLLRVVFLLFPKGASSVQAYNTEGSADKMWKATAIGLWRSPLFGGQIVLPIPDTEKLIDSALALASVSERIKLIYNTVKNRIPEKVDQSFSSSFSIVDAWNNKNGNKAALNLILLNLLRKAKVQAYPILISTRSNGRIKTDFPSFGQINGLNVLAVDSLADQVFVMDASNKWQSHRIPPLSILNRQVLMLDSADIKWVTIEDERPLMKHRLNIAASFSEDGKLEGRATSLFYDYAKELLLDSTERSENEEALIDKKPPELQILSEKFDWPENDMAPAGKQIMFSYALPKTDDFYFINPQFLMTKKKNSFTGQKRNTDIDFGANQQVTLTLNISVPSSYQVEFLPKSTLVRASDSSFFYRRVCESDGSTIYFTQTFEIARAVFTKEDYPSIQDFFNRAYALMAQEIILKKKK